MSSPATKLRSTHSRQGTPRSPNPINDDPPQRKAAAPRSAIGRRRRSVLACLPCRKRKVRCNVVEQSPCSNCHWDGIECRTDRSKKRWDFVHFRPEFQEPQQIETRSKQGRVSPCSEFVFVSSPAPLGLIQTYSLPASRFYKHWGLVDSLSEVEDEESAHAFSSRSPEQHRAMDLFDHFASPSDGVGLENGVASPNGPIITSLVQQVCTRLAPEDVLYLRFKGALTVPSGRFCNALLDSFIRYVYPHLPVVDIEELLQVFSEHQGQLESGGALDPSFREQGSLLLIQAVMFAAVAFVDIEHIRHAGFPSRRVARKHFYEIVKVLYTFDCEQSPLINTQVLLLMTLWHDTLDDEKDASHWIGVALTLMGFIDTESLPSSKLSLWKRVQWCCLVRDSLVSLGMRHPMKISLSTFRVPQLEQEDFETTTAIAFSPLSPQLTSMLEGWKQRRHELAKLFIAECQLCCIIAQILDTQYVAQNRQSGSMGPSTKSTMLLYPKKIPDFGSLEAIDRKLVKWQNSLPENCGVHSLVPATVEDPEELEFLLHRITIQLKYQGTIEALHRPSGQAPVGALSEQEMMTRTASRLRTLQAAENISLMASTLNTLGLGRLLPSTALSTLVPAMMVLVIEWKADVQGCTRHETMVNIRQCHTLLQSLRELYNAADFGLELVRAALGRDASLLDEEPSLPPTPETLDSIETWSLFGSPTSEDSGVGQLGESSVIGDAENDIFGLCQLKDATCA